MLSWRWRKRVNGCRCLALFCFCYWAWLVVAWQIVQVVLHNPHERFVYPGRLSVDKQRALWKQIKRDNPALADLLVEPGFVVLKSNFDAEVYFKAGDLRCSE